MNLMQNWRKKKPKPVEKISIARGRMANASTVAVVDIGSNSVRQVIYESLTRSPAILLNEKVQCGLGKGVTETGSLEPEAVERTFSALKRFRALAIHAGAEETHLLATAAVREARNGKEFTQKIEKMFGLPVNILTGEAEAEFAAYGIKSGFHKPSGIVGDLGGGSLELATVDKSDANGMTFPLGALHLNVLSEGDAGTRDKLIAKALKGLKINWPDKSRTFYAVGGTWRSLARLHMIQTRYPCDIIHDYRVDAKKYIRFCKKVAKSGIADLRGVGEISKNREMLIPEGAAVLASVLTKLKVEEVAMSQMGVREGFLYSLLSKEERNKDSLIEAAKTLSILRSRSPKYAKELAQWTTTAFKNLELDETEDERRYRIASCYLSDIAWRSNSDFRAEQTIGIILNAGFGGIDHSGRAYLTLAAFHRYQGFGEKSLPPKIKNLATPRLIARARLTAAFQRMLFMFSASVSGILPSLKFKQETKKEYIISIPIELRELIGERPMVRVEQLAREADVAIRLVVDD